MKPKYLLFTMFLLFIVGLYIPTSYSQNSCPGIPTVIYAGKTYHTVAIGDQCWLRENLDVGVLIDSLSDQSNNGIIEKYCYENNPAYCTTYGGLYQWAEAVAYTNGATNTTQANPPLTGNVQGICPSGWHIPSDLVELLTLRTFVNNDGNALKAVGQGTGDGAGTNTSGFSALLAGVRTYYGFFVNSVNLNADFWSSSEHLSAWNYPTEAGDMHLYNETQGDGLMIHDKAYGFSVRCLNDMSVSTMPVEMSLFTAIANGRTIQLNWETKTEKNSDKFNIERKTINSDWGTIATIKAAVLSNSPKQYLYTDKNLQAGKYEYRLKMIDNDGTFEYSKVIETEVAVPKNFELSQNYPNPWNPSTKINYTLPSDSKVILEVYNISGERISQLVNEDQSAGYYSEDFNASKLSSGIYFYRITAVDKATGKDFSAIKKMILLK